NTIMESPIATAMDCGSEIPCTMRSYRVRLHGHKQGSGPKAITSPGPKPAGLSVCPPCTPPAGHGSSGAVLLKRCLRNLVDRHRIAGVGEAKLFGVPVDYRQDVIEVVAHTTGQSGDRV